jgi:hypothetical protein
MLARTCATAHLVFPPGYFCFSGYTFEQDYFSSITGLGSTFWRMLPMEMMDIQFAVRWFDESVGLMIAQRKSLESHPKDEPDALKREFIAASRDLVGAQLEASTQAAIAITRQMTLELLLLMEHPQDFAALKKAEALYTAENIKTWRLFEQTAPTNPEPRMSGIPDDIRAEINELMARAKG